MIAALELSAASLVSVGMSLGILAQLKEQKKNLQREIYRAGRPFEEQVRLLIGIRGVTPVACQLFLRSIRQVTFRVPASFLHGEKGICKRWKSTKRGCGAAFEGKFGCNWPGEPWKAGWREAAHFAPNRERNSGGKQTPLLALGFLSEVGDIRRFRSLRSLLAYLGVVPTVRSSRGTTRVGRLNPRSRCLARTLFTQAVLHLADSSPVLGRFYRELVPRRGYGRAHCDSAKNLRHDAQDVALQHTL